MTPAWLASNLGYHWALEVKVSGLSLMVGIVMLLLLVFALALTVWLVRKRRELLASASAVRDELVASEARYRMLAENASDVIWSVSLPDFRFTYISPSVVRLRGLRVEEAMGETFIESVVPEQRDRVERIIEQRLAAFRSGQFDASEAQRLEVRQPTADGRSRTVEIIAKLIVDRAGEVTGIQGISRDVSRRKQRERDRLSREAVLSALARGARALFNAGDKDDAMQRMLAGLGQAVKADRVYVFEHHMDESNRQQLASMRYEWVNEGITAQIDNPEMQSMAYELATPNWIGRLRVGEPVYGLVSDMEPEEQALLAPQGIVSIVVMPIFLEGEIWGQIGFDDCTRQHQWSQVEIDALEIAAATVGAAIRGIRAEQELKRQVSTDGLTGLLSRRAFLESAKAEYAQAWAGGAQFALLILDLDHFKTVNDTHGHPVGDEALKAFAEVCRLTLREDDLIGRMGGEEFAVVLRDVNGNDADAVAEKLRAEVQKAHVELQGLPLKLTVSIGLAMSGRGETEFSELLKFADQALYRAKRAGRNRVERAPGQFNPD